MDTVKTETWPPPPERESDLPNFFKVEGVRVTRSSDSLCIENIVGRTGLLVIPAVGAPIFPVIELFKFWMHVRGHFLIHMSHHATMLALLKFAGVCIVASLALFVMLIALGWTTSMWRLLLEKPGSEKTKLAVNFGTLRSIQGICISEFRTRRGSSYRLYLTQSEDARILSWRSKNRCRFAVFRDRANAQRVAQVISDFTNFPIEHEKSNTIY